MANKKILLLIVEGPSDDDALGVIFSRFFDRASIEVEICHDDITTRRGVRADNIPSKISSIVRTHAKNNHYTYSDFAGVIHLIDTDGAYIPDEAVKEDSSVGRHPYYTTTEIRASDPGKIRYRNKIKRDNMDRLADLHKVWRTVPYAAYYMSSNLDHVLYDKLNTSDTEKEDNAIAFALQYKDHIDECVAFLQDSDFSVCTTLKDSWAFIREGLHSLERHTNLGLCFREAAKSQTFTSHL